MLASGCALWICSTQYVPFLSKTYITKPEFVVLGIHIVIISTVLTEFVLIVFDPPGEVRPPLLCLILFGTTSAFALEHGLVKRARRHLVRLYLGLLHLLIDLDEFLRLLAGST